MSIAVAASGTQTATITTEHSLLASSASATFILSVDVSALAADEVLELRIKTNILAAGAVRTAYMWSIVGPAATDDMIQISVPISSDQGATFTLKQVNGVGRAFPWKVITL